MVTDVRVLVSNVAMSSGTVCGRIGVPVRPLGPFVGQWWHTAGPGAVDRARGIRRQHGECAEPDAAEQRRAAECRRCRLGRNLDCAVAKRGARRSRCRGARGLQTPLIRTPTPTPAGRPPPRIPIIAARRTARTNSRPTADATGGTGNDQFTVERLGADCRQLWFCRNAAVVPAITRVSAFGALLPHSAFFY